MKIVLTDVVVEALKDAPRWQARVNQNWRFYFEIMNDAYRILKLIPHPKK